MNAIRENIGQDVQSANITSTGAAVAGPCRLKALYFRHTATAGKVVLRDGGATGTVKLTLDAEAAAGVKQLQLPEGGMVFDTDVHATLTNVDSLTVIYR